MSGGTLFDDAGEVTGQLPGRPAFAHLPPCESCRGTGRDAGAVGAWQAGTPCTYPSRRELLDVFVPGEPKTAGSLKAFVNPKTNRAIVTRANKGSQNAWRADVQAAVLRLWGDPESRPLVPVACSIYLEFVMTRPKALPKSRTPRHTKRPDADKLIRAIKDALTGVVWADDAQADAGSWHKRYAEVGEAPGCHIRVTAEE